MNKSGIAGIAMGLAALVLAMVNMVRVSGAMTAKADVPATGTRPAEGTPEKDVVTPQERAAEIEYLKKETARLSAEIEKARIAIAKGERPTIDPNTGQDEQKPLPLTPADLGAILDATLEKRFREGKLREAEFKAQAVKRAAGVEAIYLEEHLGLKPAQKSVIEAILNSQADAYGEVLRIFPPPDDRQARLDKITAESEDQVNKALEPAQQQVWKLMPKGWHGLAPQKVDAGHREKGTGRDGGPRAPEGPGGK